jgi:hypothetical protein
LASSSNKVSKGEEIDGLMGKKEKESKDKPLDKMTAKELREAALKIPEITGVHAMNKVELVAAVKQARGIVEEKGKRSGASTRQLKKKIHTLKVLKTDAHGKGEADRASILRRRISRLKKRTRKAE